jgi:FtsZ-interacting cell division protein ZipA
MMIDFELLVILVVIMVVVIAAIFWLLNENRKLKSHYRQLLKISQRTSRDVAGLCSAAVIVDNQISINGEQLQHLLVKITEYEQPDEPDQPYHSVIQKVIAGADAQQLMQECGISRDEALLLIRLHSSAIN